jgi:hypothetical protein
VSKANSTSKSVRDKTKELREVLNNADMAEFDRIMRHLTTVPKSKIDANEKKMRAKGAK